MYTAYNEKEIEEMLIAGVKPKARIQLFKAEKITLKVADYKKLSQYCSAKSFNAGDVLFSESDEGNEAYFILQGIVHLKSFDGSVKALKIGDLIGEFSIGGDLIRRETATFITKGVALIITHIELDAIVLAEPTLGFKFVQNFMAHIKIADPFLKGLDDQIDAE
jgi:CRP-like cAMP-binding protein